MRRKGSGAGRNFIRKVSKINLPIQITFVSFVMEGEGVTSAGLWFRILPLVFIYIFSQKNNYGNYHILPKSLPNVNNMFLSHNLFYNFISKNNILLSSHHFCCFAHNFCFSKLFFFCFYFFACKQYPPFDFWESTTKMF